MLDYKDTVRQLSERVVNAQRPIRILDALKWDSSIQAKFFQNKCQSMPAVDLNYYQSHPIKFDTKQKLQEFADIERDIKRELGQFSGVGQIMQRMCREYCIVIRMLESRGTSDFNAYSQQLYGSTQDAFYAGAPTLNDLALSLSSTLKNLKEKTKKNSDLKQYDCQAAVEILGKRMGKYFSNPDEKVRVVMSDEIVADASAGAECIKLRKNKMFNLSDLRVLEVHEGWVHLGTTLNGMNQPTCTFLSKGPPSSTITQEGLAIIMEIFSFSSYPSRMQGLSDRITATHMAEQGANFIEVFHFFKDQGFVEEDSYNRSMRVFRGSTPEGKPFTKDLVYNKGFILIYNFIRLAIEKGSLELIPLLFLGKTTLEDLRVLHDLVQEGLVSLPRYLPKQFKDLRALSSWMSYSLFLNQLDVKRLSVEYKGIL